MKTWKDHLEQDRKYSIKKHLVYTRTIVVKGMTKITFSLSHEFNQIEIRNDLIIFSETGKQVFDGPPSKISLTLVASTLQLSDHA